MNDFWKKYGPGIGFILVISALLFVLKMQWDASKQRDAMNKQMIEMKQLQDGIVRNQSKYVSPEDLQKFAKDINLNLDAIQEDMDKFDAEVKGISKIVAASLGRQATNIPSSWVRPRPKDPENPLPVCPDGEPCPDPYGYLTNAQMLALTEPFPKLEVPIGSVTFESWKKKPWSVDILPRQYHVSTVLGQDEEGRHYVYNQMQIEADGKKHKIPIQQAEFQEVYPESEFHFNPKMHLGVDVGAVVTNPHAEVVPNLQVSLFSYGRTKKNADTEWSILGIGAGYGTQTQSFNVVLTPFNYNVGQHIPLVESVHLGPTVSVDTNGEFSVLGGLRVGL